MELMKVAEVVASEEAALGWLSPGAIANSRL
jgi:hypothetical protein